MFRLLDSAIGWVVDHLLDYGTKLMDRERDKAIADYHRQHCSPQDF